MIPTPGSREELDLYVATPGVAWGGEELELDLDETFIGFFHMDFVSILKKARNN